MATLTYEAYVNTPVWTNISTNTLVFSGSASDLTATVAVAAWQTGTHLGNGTPGTDQCGSTHANNCQYISSNQVDIGAGTVALSDANVAADDCTFRTHFNDAGAYAASNAQLYVYDGTTPATRATGLDVMVFQRGETETAWTEVNNDSGAVGGTGNQKAMASKTSAADHYWHVAASVSPETAGGKSAFSFGFSMDYS